METTAVLEECLQFANLAILRELEAKTVHERKPDGMRAAFLIKSRLQEALRRARGEGSLDGVDL